jgi:hypothetical protein
MANFGAALAGGFQGYDAYQKDKQKRELEAIDLMTRQQSLRLEQQKADMQAAAQTRQQKADENAAAVLQGFYAGPNGQGAVPPQAQQQPAAVAPQPQQTAPGQPSVPMQQPGQRPPMPPQQGQQSPPLPPGGPQGQMPPPGTPPLPPGQPGGAQPPVRPYQRIGNQPAPQAQPQPPQAQQPVQIPKEAPAPNSLDFKSAVQILKARGIQGGPELVDALDRLKPYIDDAAKAETQALKNQLAVQKSLLDIQKAMQTGNHEAAMEANANARLALENQRLALEGSRIGIEAAAKAETAAHFKAEESRAGVPVGFERGPDGKVRPMEGGPMDPKSPSYRPPKGSQTGQTVADKMNPTMLASVRLDIGEVDLALGNIKKLATDTAGPYYAYDHAGPLGNIMGRALTSDQQQQYETAMNRMAVAIASMQSMGRGQISDAKVNEARKLVPQLGDKPGNRKFKLQQIQKLRDKAEQTLNSPLHGNPAEPDQDREAATAGSVPGGGNPAPKELNYDPATGTFK